jgi:hypothetical protein
MGVLIWRISMDTMNTTVMSTYPEEIEQLVETRLTAQACQVIAYVFNYNGWKPYKPLSVSELWKCVWICCNKARHAEIDELVSLIEQGYFYVPHEIRYAHDILRSIDEEYRANH